MISTPAFEVRIADTLADVEAALRLRFEVFNLELHEGLASSYHTGFDSDVYDTFCDHLIVKERETGNVVGTYRLLRQQKALANIGFYSEGEFDLGRIKLLEGESLEVGRSCVAKEFRTAAVINLLWGGIARYMEIHGIVRLFGCVSLHTKENEELIEIHHEIRTKYLSAEKYRVTPLPRCAFLPVGRQPLPPGGNSAFRKFPPLLKGYLRLGAVICGDPAMDREFGTIDYLILVELDAIAERYRNHYCTAAAYA